MPTFSRAAILVSASCQRRHSVVRSQPRSPLICFHGTRAARDLTSLRSTALIQSTQLKVCSSRVIAAAEGQTRMGSGCMRAISRADRATCGHALKYGRRGWRHHQPAMPQDRHSRPLIGPPVGNARAFQSARGPRRRCAGDGGGRWTRTFGTDLRASLPSVLPFFGWSSRRRNRSTQPTRTLQKRVDYFRQHIEITSVKGWSPTRETALSKGHPELPSINGMTLHPRESAEPFHPSGMVECERVPVPMTGSMGPP